MPEFSESTTLLITVIFWAAVGVFAYTHIFYPALMAALSVRKQKTESPAELPSVTLIIPAYNEEAVLEAKLQNALSIDYPGDRLEIVVASDGSVDRSVSIARSFEPQGVRVLPFEQRRGKASVLNDAVAASTSDVICLCDANVMFRPDALQRLVARLVDPAVGAVSGDVRLASHESDFGEGESLYYRIDGAIQTGESSIGSMIGVDGGMYVIRKDLFRPLPHDTILDDFVTTMHVIQQGQRVVYEPSAVADENGTPSTAQEFRRRVRISAGAVQSLKRGQYPPISRPIELWQYVSHKLLRWIGPLPLLLMLAGSLLLWNAGGIYRIAFAGQAIVGLTAAAAWISVPFRETRAGGIPFYFVMSHVAMTVGILRGILNRQRVTWTKTGRTSETSGAHAA